MSIKMKDCQLPHMFLKERYGNHMYIMISSKNFKMTKKAQKNTLW